MKKITLLLMFIFMLPFIGLAQNEDCSGALTATVTPFGDISQPISFDTTGALDATVVPSCEGFDSTESDLWYTFTTNATDGVTLSLLSGNAGDIEGAIYDACGGAELFCFADGSSVDFNSDVLVTGLTANTTYFLQVYTEGFSEGAFSIAVTDLPACPSPQNINVTNITTDSVDLNWDDVANATNGFEWFVFASGDDPATATPVATATVGAGVITASVSGLTPQTAYDFYVSSDCSADGTSVLSGPEPFTTLALPPANDECSTAINLTVNSDLNCTSVTSGTTAGATASSQADDVTGTPDNDVWFSFVATQEQHQVSLDNVQAVIGTSNDMGMGLYDGTSGCSALSLVDDSDPNTLSANGLTIGSTYLVRVYGWSSSNTAQTTFDVCVGTPPPPPSNDDCSGALPLTVTTDNTTFTSFSTDFATEGTDELTDCDAFGNLGVWYTFTAPSTTVEFLQGASGDPGVTIYEGPDCSNLTELTANCINNNSGTITGLTVGNTYYAMVWTDSAQATAEFVLFFEQCPSPNNLSVTNITTDSVDLNWDDVTNATNGFEWFVFASGDDPATATPVATGTVGAGVLTVSVAGLTPQTAYDFYVSSDCDTDGTSVLAGPESFSTLALPPANDDLCDAIALTVDAPSTGDAFTNVGATAQANEPAAACFNGGVNGSVWFTFVAPASGSVQVTTDIAGATLTDTEIAVYEAPTDCADLTTLGAELDCDQDGGTTVAFNSTLNFVDLVPGNTYYVQVDQWGSSTPGTFGLEVNESVASVQVIHNSADPSAEFVDVYLNGSLLLDDFEFRTATPFVDVPAGAAIDIDIAPFTSVDVTESIFNLNTTLTADESYIVVADGVIDPTQFDSSVNTIDFNLEVFSGAQQASTNAGETSVLVHHGSPDAPTVDVREISVPAGIIVDDISYPEFQGYLDLANQDYEISVELGDNSAVVASYQAPLATLGLADQAISVLASGFLDPAANQSGAAFGLWAALPAGGPLVELPEFTPPPANDDLCDAIALTVDAPSTGDAFTNVGATAQANEPEGSCFSGGVIQSVWFTFDAPASGEVTGTTDIAGATFTDTEIAVYDAPTNCSDLSTLGGELGCDQDGGSIVNFNSILDLTGLTPGNTYYIQVDPWNTASPGTFGIRVLDANPPCPAPSNLNVSNITTDAADLNWDDVTNATNGFEWFVFASGDDPATAMPVATGTVGAGIITANVTGLSAATPYDFYVSSDCDTDGTSILAGPESFITLSVNDECSGALPATVTAFGDTSQPVNFDTTGAQDASVVPSCEGFDSTESDLWYTFTTNATDGVTLSLLSGNAGDIEGAIYDACGGAELFCFADGSSVDFNSDVLVTGLTANTTYFLQVYTEGFSEGAFSLAITDLPACAEPQNLNVSNVATDSADLNWDDVSNATNGFEWFVFASGDDPATATPVATGTVGAGVVTANVTGLTPQTDYDFYVSSDCDTNGTSTLAGPESFSTLALPPVNDDLCDAIALTIGTPSAGSDYTNVGATAQANEPVATCFNGGINGSVWFTFVAPTSGSVQVSTDIAGATLTDTEIAVYDAPTDCLDLSTLGAELGCDQDGGTTVGFNSIVDLSGLTPGNTYYVQVDQWGSTTPGTFGIEVNETLSTESFDDRNFSFYPNPAQNMLNLQTTGQVESVKVFNMLGQQVIKETPNTVSPSLNVEVLQAGTYIMNVTINGSSENFRFIKK